MQSKIRGEVGLGWDGLGGGLLFFLKRLIFKNFIQI